MSIKDFIDAKKIIELCEDERGKFLIVNFEGLRYRIAGGKKYCIIQDSDLIIKNPIPVRVDRKKIKTMTQFLKKVIKEAKFDYSFSIADYLSQQKIPSESLTPEKIQELMQKHGKRRRYFTLSPKGEQLQQKFWDRFRNDIDNLFPIQKGKRGEILLNMKYIKDYKRDMKSLWGLWVQLRSLECFSDIREEANTETAYDTRERNKIALQMYKQKPKGMTLKELTHKVNTKIQVKRLKVKFLTPARFRQIISEAKRNKLIRSK